MYDHLFRFDKEPYMVSRKFCDAHVEIGSFESVSRLQQAGDWRGDRLFLARMWLMLPLRLEQVIQRL